MANIGQFGGVQGLQNMGFPQIPQMAQAQQMGKPRSRTGKFFLGTPESFQQVPTQTMQGMQALQMLLSGGMQGLQDPYAGFDPIADYAIDQFESRIAPSISERFTAMSGDSRQGSSGFAQALNRGKTDLAKELAVLKSQYGLQNREGLLQQLKLGLTPQFDTQHTPRQGGFLERIPELAIKAAQAYATGGTSDIASGLKKIFKKQPTTDV